MRQEKQLDTSVLDISSKHTQLQPYKKPALCLNSHSAAYNTHRVNRYQSWSSNYKCRRSVPTSVYCVQLDVPASRQTNFCMLWLRVAGLLGRTRAAPAGVVKQHVSEIDVPMLSAGCCQDSTAALNVFKELHTESVLMQGIQMHA